jgi:hypothetical protein
MDSPQKLYYFRATRFRTWGHTMQDFLIAAILCLLGLSSIIVGAVFVFKQKVYVDRANDDKVTEIDVPLFGKLKTNTPAIALTFVGAIFGYFAADLMKKRNPDEVPFQGEISIDKDSNPGVEVVMVGITSGSWIQPTTPIGTADSIPVTIKVPNTWHSYTAFAFAIGTAKTRPVLLGSSLENPTFKLSIKP